MPKRNDIKSILLIGSGPIVIGQACEFDYSGTQAIKALREEGYRVILINSNPATIMTDPEFADATYIEPITAEFIEKVIAKERPDAVLPTMGGQTALNAAIELHEKGILQKYNCELIGASVEAIKTAEDRDLFKKAMEEIGIESAKSCLVKSIEEAEAWALTNGYPMVLRPSRTLGGTGGGIIQNKSELASKVTHALMCSPNHEVLIEESLIGWKEIELEVMRDKKDNVVIVCPIENFDPMGVHTGDSITVAPIQTLTDKEYQILRDASIKVMRKIGVDTGGSNVQFAMDPETGRVIVIEMNPRVSRSSALASKATGFPIAKIAAKLAVGYTLDEVRNDITKETPACFEPSIDYVVVKVPRFNFEKFPGADNTLGTQMKSVGEVMSFGRNFSEALQKAMCSMEMDSAGFDMAKVLAGLGKGEILDLLRKPQPLRLWFIGEAFRNGATIGEVNSVTGMDPWYLTEISEIIKTEEELLELGIGKLDNEKLRALKRAGFSDRRLSDLLKVPEVEIRKLRSKAAIKPCFKSIDTCAAEFKAGTPYMYSSYDHEAENVPTNTKKVMILGSGPNRIGQGIEFDYCCVHAVFALQEESYEAIMVNCNPETVSTDYDISDRLYFEPLTFESVMEIVEREKPEGVIVQFGGQTPLKLAGPLHRSGVPIIGTSVESIDVAEDREMFAALIQRLGLKQAEFGTARSLDEAVRVANRIGYPLMIRPSFVLGGRSMRVIHNQEELTRYIQDSVLVSNERPVLLDRYLDNAVEVDVDAVCDGKEAVIAGVMEHIERAGIHSGDSCCSLPPKTLSDGTIAELKRQTKILALELKVKGLINVQFAISKDGVVYVLEVNPRASRTVPFVGKVTGIPWAKIAAKLMLGKTIQELGVVESPKFDFFAIKAPVFPFRKFPGVDTILGPEMKSTGEVMGIDQAFEASFAKALSGMGTMLPTSGKVFLSVRDGDKAELVDVARGCQEAGFKLIATSGTCDFLNEQGFQVERVNKVREGSPHVVDLLGQGEISLIVNTPEGSGTLLDSRSIRLVANELNIPTFTTIAAAQAAVRSILMLKRDIHLNVASLQEYHVRISSKM